MKIIAVALLALGFSARAAEPADAFRGWSAFERIDLAKLAKGKVVTEGNSSMNFARGISVQAVYVVAAPLDVASRVLLASDPTKHKELEVYQHRQFQNEREAEFDKLKLDPKLSAVRNLLEALKTRDGLHLSSDESARLPKAATPDDAQRFFAGILRERWGRLVQRGEFDMRGEIQSLLGDERRIAGHFAALLAPLTQPAAPHAPAAYYWNLSNVNKIATLELGAVHTRTEEGVRHVLELTCYASSGYLASLTLYELVPIALAGRPATLVWQGCLVSSEQLAGALGLKKPIAVRLMAGDLEDSIHFFQRDAAAAQ